MHTEPDDQTLKVQLRHPETMKARTSTIYSVERSSNGEISDPPPHTKPQHIIFACLLILSPLLVVAVLLIVFVTHKDWTVFDPDDIYPGLPFTPLDTSTFNTLVLASKVNLTSSWSSNIAQFATTPFMLIFSFLVAQELANRTKTSGAETEDVKGLLRGNKYNLLKWASGSRHSDQRYASGKATRIAGYGAVTSLILTIALILGDKLLQATVSSSSCSLYDEVSINSTEAPGPLYGFKLLGNCTTETTAADMYDLSTLPPCSINQSTKRWTLSFPEETYRIIETGIMNDTGNFNKQDFDRLDREWDAGTGTETHIVTYINNQTKDQHAFYFNPNSAYEESAKIKRGVLSVSTKDIEHLGLDYMAPTISVTTKCIPITTACGMHNVTDDDEKNFPVQYNCSDIFQGTADGIPQNGIEKLQGWNSSFYNLDKGVPRAIGMAAQLNPFTYNVTAVLNSIDFQSLIDFGDPQVHTGQVVNAGGGRVALALSCSSTVYNVKYSMVNGNISHFNTTLASPAEAAIVKAPLQAGFGSYTLYQKASIAVLMSDISAADAMGLSFSQMALALAQGSYGPTNTYANRLREDILVTHVPKGPFYFLVICLFLYAVVVLVFTGIALAMRRPVEVLDAQAELVPWQPVTLSEVASQLKTRGSEFFGKEG